MKRFLILALLLSVLFCACATTPQLSPVQTFAVADREFTDTVKKYNLYYADLDPATKEQWDKDFRPIIRETNAALDIWKEAVYLNLADAEAKQQAFLAIKSRLFLLLKDKLIE